MNYFLRDGNQAQTEIFTSGSKAYTNVRKICHRCGGQGWLVAFQHVDGGVCYECGGAGFLGSKRVPVYTEDQLGELNARAEKAERTRQVKQAAIEAEKAAQAQQRFSELCSSNLFAAMEMYKSRSEFLADLLTKAQSKGALSEKQIEAAQRVTDQFKAQEAKKNDYIGSPGEKIEVELKVVKVLNFSSDFGVCFLHICETNVGETVTYKGNAAFLSEGETGIVRAKIKAHNEYRGIRQTVIERPKIIANS